MLWGSRAGGWAGQRGLSEKVEQGSRHMQPRCGVGSVRKSKEATCGSPDRHGLSPLHQEGHPSLPFTVGTMILGSLKDTTGLLRLNLRIPHGALVQALLGPTDSHAGPRRQGWEAPCTEVAPQKPRVLTESPACHLHKKESPVP